jgi:hypothetical protein
MLAAAEHAVGRGHVLAPPVGVVLADAGDRAHFVEAVLVEQAVDALAHRQAAGVVLALDLVGPAHLVGHGGAPGQFVEFGVPGHRHRPRCGCRGGAQSSAARSCFFTLPVAVIGRLATRRISGSL